MLIADSENVFMCRILISIGLSLFTVSFLSTLAVSIDRYFAICHHSYYRMVLGKKYTLVSIAVCWIMSFFGFAPVFGWRRENSCDYKCILSDDFIIIVGIFFAFIPSLILSIVHGIIYKTIYNQVRALFLRYFILRFQIPDESSRRCHLS